MSEYLVKVGFWLRAYDSVTVEAESDADAIDSAKTAAQRAMQLHAFPESIDLHERRQGVIAYVDRVESLMRYAIAEDIAFDDDCIAGLESSN